MKARYTNYNSSLTFEIESDGPKGIFKELAAIQEVFDSEKRCGVCQSEDIRFLFRQIDDFDFYELMCRAPGCRARFAFGQAKKGGALFPKRKDEDGNWIDNGGWVKYQKPGETGPAPAQSSNGTSREPDMQDTYQRLAARFGIQHPPVSFQAALALLHGRMEGVGALAEYDTVQSNLVAQHPQGVTDPAIKKKVLADLWNKYTEAKSAVDDVPF